MAATVSRAVAVAMASRAAAAGEFILFPVLSLVHSEKRKKTSLHAKNLKTMIRTHYFSFFPLTCAVVSPSFFLLYFSLPATVTMVEAEEATTREEAVAGESRKLLLIFVFCVLGRWFWSSFRPLLLTLPSLSHLFNLRFSPQQLQRRRWLRTAATGRRRRLRRPLGDATLLLLLLRQREEEREKREKRKKTCERASEPRPLLLPLHLSAAPRVDSLSLLSLPPISLSF